MKRRGGSSDRPFFSIRRDPGSFTEYLVEHQNIDESTFPNARLGLKVYRVMRKFFIQMIVFALIGWGLWFASGYIKSPERDPFAQWTEKSPVTYPQVVGWFHSFVHGSGIFFLVLSGLALVGVLIAWGIYFCVCFTRWKNFERQCFTSDWRAEHLRRGILNATKAKERLSSARRKLSKESENGGSPSIESKTAVEAARRFKMLQVYVNVRQSLDSDKIIRYHQIYLDLPMADDEIDALIKLAEPLDKVATRVANGKLNFGEMILASDRSSITFNDAVAVPDKFKKKEVVETVEEHRYDYSFPLSLFEDRSGKIAEIQMKAQRWGNTKADALDRLFATQKTQARRLRVVTSASSVMVEYDLSFNLKLDDVERKAKTIDTAFKLNGTVIGISDEGMLQVTLPLPKELNLPIDVPTMYRNIFGLDKQDEG